MKKPVEERLNQHDKEIAAIRKLVLQGMKMLVRSEKRTDNLTTSVMKLGKRVDDLTANVDRLVTSLGRGGKNGGSQG